MATKPTVLAHRRSLAFSAAHENVDKAPRTSTAAALQGHEGHVVGLRSAKALRDDPIVSNAAFQLEVTVLPTSTPRAPGSKDDAIIDARDTRANKAFGDWARVAGYRHQTGSLLQFLGVSVLSAVRDGATYIRRIQTAEAAGSHPNGLTLQGWRKEDIDTGMANFGRVYSRSGAVLIGMFFRNRSQVWDQDNTGESIFVDAKDLIEMRLRTEHDQVEGGPLYTPALVDAQTSRNLVISEMRRAQADANLVAILESTALDTTRSHFRPGPTTFTGPDGAPITNLLPTTFAIAKNAEVKWPPVRSTQTQHDITAARTAAGCHSSKQMVSGDSGDASFSAMAHAAQLALHAAGSFIRSSGYREARAKILDWFITAELMALRNWTAVEWTWPVPASMTANQLQQARSLQILTDPENPIIALSQARSQLNYEPDETADLIRKESAQRPTPTAPPDELRQRRLRGLVQREVSAQLLEQQGMTA